MILTIFYLTVIYLVVGFFITKLMVKSVVAMENMTQKQIDRNSTSYWVQWLWLFWPFVLLVYLVYLIARAYQKMGRNPWTWVGQKLIPKPEVDR